MRRRIPVALMVAAGLIGLAGCVAEPMPPPPGASIAIIAPVAPPPPRVEVIPVSPGPLWVWAPGHWYWNGHEHFWVAGRYVQRPHHRAEWEPGHWEERGYGWSWVPGHWR